MKLQSPSPIASVLRPLLLSAAIASGCARIVVPPPPASTAGVDPRSMGAAGYAKIVCSAVFVSNRDASEAARNSTYFVVSEKDRSAVVEAEVDRARQEVRVRLVDGRRRRAVFHRDQGCTIVPEGEADVAFEPVAVKTTLPDAASQQWPMGDALSEAPWPDDVDRARVEEAVDRAFADPEAFTAAVVVLHRGEIVAERYMPGIGKDTQLESWSMGKSTLATLLGLLVRDGTYRLEDPAPVPAWRASGDPRGAIRILDLLQMSSGLDCRAPGDPDYDAARGYPDHLFIYTGAIDTYTYAMQRPLQFTPGSEGRYRNCDPLTVAWLVEQAARRRGVDPLLFPQRALFDRVGIRRQVIEPDPYGHLLFPGHYYGTARDWARLGLLYLRDGVWQGQRLLPEGWSKLVSAPAPGWKKPIYGGFFWVNGDGYWVLPKDVYYMNGVGGQYVIIDPSHDLVVVRLGHLRGGPRVRASLNKALTGIVEAIRP
jgi:CubicO group peptidase (beta-lactamase class C family)